MGQEKQKEKDTRTFAVGEKVFAKVKGYPPWPAFVVREEKLAKSRVKYHVVFYYTNEKASCKPEDIFPYGSFKEKYGKPSKRPYFNRALELIEQDTPDLTKYSHAEKMSAIQADVEEIQKQTRKRALEDEVGAGSDKKNKRRKVLSESSENSSHNITSKQKKSNKKSDNLGHSDINNVHGQENDDAGNGSDSFPVRKENLAKNKKRKQVFQAKSAGGQDPSVHLQLVEKLKERPAGSASRGVVKRGSERNTGKVAQKESTSKAGRSEISRERQKNEEEVPKQNSHLKGTRQRTNKENEKNSSEEQPQKNSVKGSNASTKINNRITGWNRHSREQYDITSFERGDQVFAKVKGYPPWPAVVTALANETHKKKKYHVTFYASNQRGICPAEHIFPYELYKDEYGSPHKKNAAFNKALGLIRKAAGDNIPNDTDVAERSGKRQKNDSPNGDASNDAAAASGSHNGQSVDDAVPNGDKPNGTDDVPKDK